MILLNKDLVLPLAVKTVFFAEPTLSAAALLPPLGVGDLNDIPFEAVDEVVSGPGLLEEGITMCKPPFSAAAIAAETTLGGAVVEKPEEKFVKNSPGSGTFSVRAAAAAMTEAGGDEDTAKSVDVDLSDKCCWCCGVATVDNNDDVENMLGPNDDGGLGDIDDSEDGEAAIERPCSSHPLPKSSSRTSSLTSGGLQSSGIVRLDKLAAPRTKCPFCPFTSPIPITLDMLMSDMDEELDRSGHVCDDGLLIFGQESELTIFRSKLFLLISLFLFRFFFLSQKTVRYF